MKQIKWIEYKDLGNSDEEFQGMSINDIFNLYVLKTNFPISEEDGLIISHIDGIEVVSFVSKYQIVIGIAELFNEDFVKKEIEKALRHPEAFRDINSLDCEETKKTLSERRDEICVYKHWAILLAPNGQIKSIFSDHLDDFLNQKKNLEHYNNLFQGLIVSSED